MPVVGGVQTNETEYYVLTSFLPHLHHYYLGLFIRLDRNKVFPQLFPRLSRASISFIAGIAVRSDNLFSFNGHLTDRLISLAAFLDLREDG
jgi:hypothetical protein